MSDGLVDLIVGCMFGAMLGWVLRSLVRPRVVNIRQINKFTGISAADRLWLGRGQIK
jgi:hypothetical protein